MIWPLEKTGRDRFRLAALLVVRLILATVFLYAGATKLGQESGNFADSIASFRLLPLPLVNPLALALPPFELMIGVALLIGKPERLGSFCALVSSAVFFAALITATLRGIPVDCGCFGNGPDWWSLTTLQRTWFDLARDGVMAIGSFLLYRHEMTASIVSHA